MDNNSIISALIKEIEHLKKYNSSVEADYRTELKKSESALNQRMTELEAVNAMSRSVSMNFSLKEVVRSALDQLMTTLSPDLVLIYLIDENNEMTLQNFKRSAAITDFPKEPKSKLHVGECLCGLAAVNSQSVFSINLHEDNRCTNSECKMAGIISYASIPIINREKLIGVVGIGSCIKRDFSLQSIFLESLISIIASSVSNTLLHEQVITYTKQLEEHADELENLVAQRTVELKKFFNAVESSPASIVITDIEGNIEYANPFFTKLTGYSLEEAVGKNPRILKSGLHKKEFYEQMWKTLSAGDTWRGEICNRKKNGELYWENAAISPLKPDNSTINFVAVKEDITQKKSAGKALKESEQRYKTIFEWSQDGIIVAEQTSKKFLFCNNSAALMFGYTKEELSNKSVLDIHPPADISFVISRFELQSRGEITYAAELPCMKKDGTLFYCDINATAVIIDDIPCSMGFFRDVTERRRSQELKDDVERIMRHDLKSPLSAIIGFPQIMINNDNLTPNQKKYLKFIMDAGQNMLDMINLSLTTYKIEAGTYKYTPSMFNLIKVLRQCLSNNDTLCTSKNITIKFWIDKTEQKMFIEDIERIEFNGEYLLAFAVFSNLILNAVEASPEGESVNIIIEPESVPVRFNSRIKVIIHNKGAVPLDIRDRFFDKYITSGKQKGTGLGTYSAKLFANIQGWIIEMKTSEETGTYIIVTIKPS